MSKRNDTIHKIFNIVLGILYVPLSCFWFLCCMAAETALVTTDPYRIISAYIVAFAGLLSPLLAVAGLRVSGKLYRTGKIAASYILRFLPVLFFSCSCLLALLIESLGSY